MTILEAIENYVRLLNGSHGDKYSYLSTLGKKYARIVKADKSGNHESVHTFVSVDKGDIFFASSYKAPSKRIVGNVLNPDPLAGTNWHGGNYAH